MMNLKKGKLVSFRAIALFVALSIAASECYVWAMPLPKSSPVKPNSEFSLTIPKELGKVDFSIKGSSGKEIIYIQDAHDHLEAQENIARIIDYLVKKEKVQTVFEEGYEGEVPTDAYFGHISNPETKFKVSHYLMDQLRIGGAEFAHINRNKDFTLIGADSIDLHLENVNWYKEAASRMKVIDSDLDRIQGELRVMIQKNFPSPLKEWIKLRGRYDENKIDLLSYLKRSFALFDASSSGEFPMISLLFAAEATSDAKIIEAVKRIDAVRLIQEVKKMEDVLAGHFLKDADLLKVFDYFRGVELLRRLNHLQISSDEFKALRSDIERYATRAVAEFIAAYNRKPLVLSKKWEENIKTALKFYKTANARDEAIANRIDEFLAGHDEKRAVLVFGGFHKDAIEKILLDRKVSFHVVSPRISDEDPIHTKRYKVLMSQGYQPLEIRGILPQASRYPALFVQTLGSALRLTGKMADIIETHEEPVAKQMLSDLLVPMTASRSEIRNELDEQIDDLINPYYKNYMQLKEKSVNLISAKEVTDKLLKKIAYNSIVRDYGDPDETFRFVDMALFALAEEGLLNHEVVERLLLRDDEWSVRLREKMDAILLMKQMAIDGKFNFAYFRALFESVMDDIQNWNQMELTQLSKLGLRIGGYGYTSGTDLHHSAQAPHYFEVLKRILQYDNPRFLDVGFGTGILLYYLKFFGVNGEGIGVDLSMVNLASNMGLKVYRQDVFELEPTDLDLDHGQYDVINMSNIFDVLYTRAGVYVDAKNYSMDALARRGLKMLDSRGVLMMREWMHSSIALSQLKALDGEFTYQSVVNSGVKANEESIIEIRHRSEARKPFSKIWNEITLRSGLSRDANLEFRALNESENLEVLRKRSRPTQIDYVLKQLNEEDAKAFINDSGMRFLRRALAMLPDLADLHSEIITIMDAFAKGSESDRPFTIQHLQFPSLVQNEDYPELNTVHAHYYLPKSLVGKRAPPVVIPSFRYFDAYSRLFSMYLANRGIPVLEVTMAGFGERSPKGTEKLKQWEKYENLDMSVDEYRMQILHNVIDQLVAIKWLQTREEVIPDEINLAGVSLSAKVASITHFLERSSASLTAIVPVIDISTVLWEGTYEKVGELIESRGVTREQFSQAMDMIKLSRLAEEHQGSFGDLFLVGVEDDELVPFEATERFHRQLGEPEMLVGMGLPNMSAHVTGFTNMLHEILPKMVEKIKRPGNSRVKAKAKNLFNLTNAFLILLTTAGFFFAGHVPYVASEVVFSLINAPFDHPLRARIHDLISIPFFGFFTVGLTLSLFISLTAFTIRIIKKGWNVARRSISYPSIENFLSKAEEFGITQRELGEMILGSEMAEEVFGQFKETGLLSKGSKYVQNAFQIFLESLWKEVEPQVRESFEASPYADGNLPSALIRVGEQNFHVVGTAHGYWDEVPMFASEVSSISDSVRGNGASLYTETGLRNFYNLSQAVEIPDHQLIHASPHDVYLKRLILDWPWLVTVGFLSPLQWFQKNRDKLGSQIIQVFGYHPDFLYSDEFDMPRSRGAFMARFAFENNRQSAEDVVILAGAAHFSMITAKLKQIAANGKKKVNIYSASRVGSISAYEVKKLFSGYELDEEYIDLDKLYSDTSAEFNERVHHALRHPLTRKTLKNIMNRGTGEVSEKDKENLRYVMSGMLSLEVEFDKDVLPLIVERMTFDIFDTLIKENYLPRQYQPVSLKRSETRLQGFSEDDAEAITQATEWMVKSKRFHLDSAVRSDLTEVEKEEVENLLKKFKLGKDFQTRTMFTKVIADLNLKRSTPWYERLAAYAVLGIFMPGLLFVAGIHRLYRHSYPAFTAGQSVVINPEIINPNFKDIVLAQFVRHELVHALNLDEKVELADAYAVLGLLEDEGVNFEPGGLIDNYPSPVFKRIFQISSSDDLLAAFDAADETAKELKREHYAYLREINGILFTHSRLTHFWIRSLNFLMSAAYSSALFMMKLLRMDTEGLGPEDYTRQIVNLALAMRYVMLKAPNLMDQEKYHFAKLILARTRYGDLKRAARQVGRVIEFRTDNVSRSESRLNEPRISHFSDAQREAHTGERRKDRTAISGIIEILDDQVIGNYKLGAYPTVAHVLKVMPSETFKIRVFLDEDSIQENEELTAINDVLRSEGGHNFEIGELAWIEGQRVTDEKGEEYLLYYEFQPSKKFWKLTSAQKKRIHRWRRDLYPALEEAAKQIGMKGILIPTEDQMISVYRNQIDQNPNFESVFRRFYKSPHDAYKKEQANVTFWWQMLNLEAEFWVRRFDSGDLQRSEMRQEEISKRVSERRDRLFELVEGLKEPKLIGEIWELFKQVKVGNKQPYSDVTKGQIAGDFKLDKRFKNHPNISKERSLNVLGRKAREMEKAILDILNARAAALPEDADESALEDARITVKQIEEQLKREGKVENVTQSRVNNAVRRVDEIARHKMLHQPRVELHAQAKERRQKLYVYVMSLQQPQAAETIYEGFFAKHPELDQIEFSAFINDFIEDARFERHPNIKDLDTLQRVGAAGKVEARRIKMLEFFATVRETISISDAYERFREQNPDFEINREVFKADIRRDPRFWTKDVIIFDFKETKEIKAVHKFVLNFLNRSKTPINLTEITEQVQKAERFAEVSAPTVITVIRSYPDIKGHENIDLIYDNVSQRTRERRAQLIKFMDKATTDGEVTEISRLTLFHYIKGVAGYEDVTYGQVVGDARNDPRIRNHEIMKDYGQNVEESPEDIPAASEAEAHFYAYLQNRNIKGLQAFYWRLYDELLEEIYEEQIPLEKAQQKQALMQRMTSYLLNEFPKRKTHFDHSLSFIQNLIHDTYLESPEDPDADEDDFRSEIRNPYVVESLTGGRFGHIDTGQDLLAVVDKAGNPLNVNKTKEEAHRDGDWHQTVQVFLIDRSGNLLLQKRSKEKDISPGKLQISAGGHVDAHDESLVDSLLRETFEETGILLNPSKVWPLTRENEIVRSTESDGKMNNELTTLYVYVLDDEEKESLQKNYNLHEIDEYDLIPLVELADAVHGYEDQFSNSVRFLINSRIDLFHTLQSMFYEEQVNRLGFELFSGPHEMRLKYPESYTGPKLRFHLMGAAHGKTPNNARHVLHGKRTNNADSRLDEEGRRQAQAGAESLWYKIGRDWQENPEAYVFITSPLARTHETAQIYQDFFNAESGMSFKTIEVPEIAEIDFGIYDGLTEDEVLVQFGAGALARVQKYRRGDVTVKFPKGESYLDFIRRIQEWLEVANREYAGKTVILFGHGTYMNALDVILKTERSVIHESGYIHHRSNPFIRGIVQDFSGLRRSETRIQDMLAKLEYVELTREEVEEFLTNEVQKEALYQYDDGRRFFIRQLNSGDEMLLDDWRHNFYQRWLDQWPKNDAIRYMKVPYFDTLFNAFTHHGIGLFSEKFGEGTKLEGYLAFNFDYSPAVGDSVSQYLGRLSIQKIENYFKNIGRFAQIKNVVDILFLKLIKAAVESGAVPQGFDATPSLTTGSKLWSFRYGWEQNPRGGNGKHLTPEKIKEKYTERDLFNKLNGRSELRVTEDPFKISSVENLSEDVVFMLSEEDLRQMNETEWLELLGLKAINEKRLHIFITKTSLKVNARLEELRALSHVYDDHQMASLPKDAMVIHFSPITNDSVPAERLDERALRLIDGNYFALYSGAFATALLYAQKDGELPGLAKQSGRWVDPSNLYAGAALEQLFRSYEIISAAA